MKIKQYKIEKICEGTFIPRENMTPVISGIMRSTRVQVHPNRPYSTGTKAFREVNTDIK